MSGKPESNPAEPPRSKDFIRKIIDEDLKSGKNGSRVHTRFPPEPNGYLHIGHAKSICLNFGLAAEYKGKCNLRFDDTNPCKEDVEYVESIQEDVRWLGFDWEGRMFFASDYFEKLYEYAVDLIKQGKAYVDHLTADQIRSYRGTLTEPGKASPYRDRTVEENLQLFDKMKRGELKDGECVVRAKIDMASPNISMRDPTIYRIRKTDHHRTGSKWCVYPMYDFTHCISDALEGITHSICTLEFENNRPLYDWFLDQISVPCHPQQIEFARLNLSHTILSKRKLLELVESRVVSGWDDPRMPTISGMRRRGYTPEAIRNFCATIGVAKFDSVVDMALLEHHLREDLNKNAKRVLAVLRPIKVVITNFPDGQSEELDAVNNPEDPSAGTRKIHLTKEIYIDKDDFREDPPKDFFRLSPGKEVRLKYAYFIKCNEVIKDSKTGEVTELRCTYDPQTKSGTNPPDGRKVKGTIHWVSASNAVQAEVRLYETLFTEHNPSVEADKRKVDYKTFLNPASVEVLQNCYVEPSLQKATVSDRFQFERLGYFCLDKDSKSSKLVFNRTVTLKDTWAKIEKNQPQKKK